MERLRHGVLLFAAAYQGMPYVDEQINPMTERWNVLTLRSEFPNLDKDRVKAICHYVADELDVLLGISRDPG